MPGRASGDKMVGMAEVGAPISLDEWQSVRIVGASACVIFKLLQEIQKMANKDTIFGYHPVGAPHAYANRTWGNPAGMQHNPVLGRRVMLMMTQGLMDCGKAGDFGSVPRMLTY